MADMRYFSGADRIDRIRSIPNADFLARFPGVVGRRCDNFSSYVGFDAAGAMRPVTRLVEFKSNPSRHPCDARCTNATGRIMRCECSCGGRNHGQGFVAESVVVR